LTLIVDASVALKWYLSDEPHAAEARTILVAGEPLVAPDIVIAEVCNAAWRGVRARRIEQSQAEGIARSLPALFDVLVGGSALAERAVIIAGQLDHAVYDCFYLALAEARDTLLVTADSRLLRKLSNTTWMTRARSLTDYRPEA
jgi:predicted nucleic acid-binding protein